MKLDTHAIRYLTAEDWRVLTAVRQTIKEMKGKMMSTAFDVETGSRNHEVVPTPLITQIAGLRGGSGVSKCISNLAKVGLIAKVRNAKYDGYRLTYGGMDYLALHSLTKRKSVYSVGNQIGVGKESDIYVVADDSGNQRVLKIHRLGRISFRTVKTKRDYLRNRSTGSWMYMSRLAAMKEFTFMKLLHQHNFPVPEPLDQARHVVLMELIDAHPLRQVTEVADPPKLYAELMQLILQLASQGLIHGDFNEFNILVKEDTQKPYVIDFPQMVSVGHPNAEEYFDRDVQCIRTFFRRRFGFTSDEEGPLWGDVKRVGRLDVEAEASGFSRKQSKELDKYLKEFGRRDGDDDGKDGGEDGEEEEAGESEDDDENEEGEEYEDEDQEDEGGNKDRAEVGAAKEQQTIPKGEAEGAVAKITEQVQKL